MALRGQNNTIKLLDIVKYILSKVKGGRNPLLSVRACERRRLQKAFGDHKAQWMQILPVPNPQRIALLPLTRHHAPRHQAAKCDDRPRPKESTFCVYKSWESLTGDWLSFTCQKRTTMWESARDISRGLSCWSLTSTTITRWIFGHWVWWWLGWYSLFLRKIFNREPFFKGADNYDQLEQITKVLGTEELYAYLNKYNIGLEVALERVLGQHRAVKLSTFVNENNKHLATPDALDLLGKMMQYDHDSRPSAEECMKHPYFDEVREKWP